MGGSIGGTLGRGSGRVGRLWEAAKRHFGTNKIKAVAINWQHGHRLTL